MIFCCHHECMPLPPHNIFATNKRKHVFKPQFFLLPSNDQTPGDATFAKPGAAAAGGLGSGEMTAIPGRILPTGFMVIDVKMKPTEEGKGR